MYLRKFGAGLMFGSTCEARICAETGAILENRGEIYAVTMPTTHIVVVISREALRMVEDRDRLREQLNPLDRDFAWFHVTVAEGNLVMVDDFLFAVPIARLVDILPNVAVAMDMVHN